MMTEEKKNLFYALSEIHYQQNCSAVSRGVLCEIVEQYLPFFVKNNHKIKIEDVGIEIRTAYCKEANAINITSIWGSTQMLTTYYMTDAENFIAVLQNHLGDNEN